MTTGRIQVSTPTDHEIALTCVFEAPRALVFESFTRPELLAYWYGGAGWTLAGSEVDLRPGGAFRHALKAADGSERVVRGTYGEVARPERLVTTEAVEGEGEQVVTSTFADEGKKTRVRMTLLFPSTEARDAHQASGRAAGLAARLDKLATLLASVDAFEPPAPPPVADSGETDAQIVRLIADQLSAICTRDLERLMSYYAPEVVVFDLEPPFQHLGTSVLRHVWKGRLEAFPAGLKPEVRDLRLTHSGDLASAHWVFRFVDAASTTPSQTQWTRTTATFRRMKGRWHVVHEHLSLPAGGVQETTRPPGLSIVKE